MSLFSDISNTAENVGKSFSSGGSMSSIGNFVGKGVQALGNFYGFDNSGKWTNQGGMFKWDDEALGEVDGRNQSRAALNQAGDEFNQQQSQANALIAQQQWNSQQADILSSNTTAANTASASASGGINYGNSTPLAQGGGFSQGGGKDFLGL